MTERDYFNSIDSFIEYINMENIGDRIVAVYLGGSVSRGDFSPERSDIDIYVVKKDEDKELETMLIAKAADITNTSLAELKRVCQNPFTVAFTTINDIENGISWLGAGSEYYNFIETGKLLWGKEIKDKIQKPSADQIKDQSRQTLQMLRKMICEATEPSFTEENKDYITEGMFQCIFSAVHFILSYFEIYTRGKRTMLSSFQRLFKNTSYEETSKEILALWSLFELRSLEYDEVKKLIEIATCIVQKDFTGELI